MREKACSNLCRLLPHRAAGIVDRMLHQREPKLGHLLALADHLADLDDRFDVRIIRDVSEYCFSVRPEAVLKSFDRVAEQVAHGDVNGG